MYRSIIAWAHRYNSSTTYLDACNSLLTGNAPPQPAAPDLQKKVHASTRNKEKHIPQIWNKSVLSPHRTTHTKRTNSQLGGTFPPLTNQKKKNVDTVGIEPTTTHNSAHNAKRVSSVIRILVYWFLEPWRSWLLLTPLDQVPDDWFMKDSFAKIGVI